MIKLCMAAAVLVLCMFTGLSPHAGTAQAPGTINAQRLARVIPGISKARVKELLGVPWRTVQYNDLDELENEFWEYRGKDAQGSYRIHIEFDPKGIAVIVARVPEV
jgi:hypothetical protein